MHYINNLIIVLLKYTTQMSIVTQLASRVGLDKKKDFGEYNISWIKENETIFGTIRQSILFNTKCEMSRELASRACLD